MKRKPNVANTLLKNSISAIFSSIEIHNKPNIAYRYPTVTILILNAWELLLKSYIYKVQRDRKIVLKQKKNDRYPSLQHCINKVFIGDKNLVYKKNIETINNYRNLIIHAFTNELDEIIFSLINKNIELFGMFLKDFLDEDINKFGADLILLPIGFKKPFNPISFLGKKDISKSFSEEIGNFLNDIVIITKDLNLKSIDESILIPFKLDIISKNKVKNADIIAKIEKNGEWSISKNTSLQLTGDSSAQRMRPPTIEEMGEIFTMGYKDVKKLLSDKFQNIVDNKEKNKKIKEKYTEIKMSSNYSVLWYKNPIDNKIYFHKDMEEKINLES